MTVNKHWNLLIQEVEPIAISTALLEMKMFDEETKNKETKNSIMKISKRKDRVEMILNLLSSVQRNDGYDVFIKILWEKENIDIVNLNKLSIKMHDEAGIYSFSFLHVQERQFTLKKNLLYLFNFYRVCAWLSA